MSDSPLLDETELLENECFLPTRQDVPLEPEIESFVNELLGAVLRQITKKDISVPIFVLGSRANDVVETAVGLFDVWSCAANKISAFNDWSLPSCFNRTICFYLRDCRVFEDLEPLEISWFKTIHCTLPDEVDSQASPSCRDLILLFDVEWPSTYQSFVIDRNLTEHHIVVCTTQRLQPTESMAYVINTDKSCTI